MSAKQSSDESQEGSNLQQSDLKDALQMFVVGSGDGSSLFVLAEMLKC